MFNSLFYLIVESKNKVAIQPRKDEVKKQNKQRTDIGLQDQMMEDKTSRRYVGHMTSTNQFLIFPEVYILNLLYLRLPDSIFLKVI